VLDRLQQESVHNHPAPMGRFDRCASGKSGIHWNGTEVQRLPPEMRNLPIRARFDVVRSSLDGCPESKPTANQSVKTSVAAAPTEYEPALAIPIATGRRLPRRIGSGGLVPGRNDAQGHSSRTRRSVPLLGCTESETRAGLRWKRHREVCEMERASPAGSGIKVPGKLHIPGTGPNLRRDERVLIASRAGATAPALGGETDVNMEMSTNCAIEDDGIFSASLKKVTRPQVVSYSTRIISPPQTCPVAIRFESGCTRDWSMARFK